MYRKTCSLTFAGGSSPAPSLRSNFELLPGKWIWIMLYASRHIPTHNAHRRMNLATVVESAERAQVSRGSLHRRIMGRFMRQRPPIAPPRVLFRVRVLPDCSPHRPWEGTQRVRPETAKSLLRRLAQAVELRGSEFPVLRPIWIWRHVEVGGGRLRCDWHGVHSGLFGCPRAEYTCLNLDK
jgi:hypothetical protein